VNYVIANVINTMFRIFYILIFIDIMASWVVMLNVKLPNFVYSFLAAVHSIVTPVLAPFRRVIPSIGGLDISPIVALFVLQYAQRFIIRALIG
jgi:YggT family protein